MKILMISIGNGENVIPIQRKKKKFKMGGDLE